MADNSGMLLIDTRQVARHILEGHDWNVEGIAITDEPCCLV